MSAKPKTVASGGAVTRTSTDGGRMLNDRGDSPSPFTAVTT
jgi:hypothetical protein